MPCLWNEHRRVLMIEYGYRALRHTAERNALARALRKLRAAGPVGRLKATEIRCVLRQAKRIGEAALMLADVAAPAAPVLPWRPRPDPDVEPERRAIRAEGEWRQLSRKLWLLFEVLHARSGRPIAHEALIAYLWPPEELDLPEDARHALGAHIMLLRRRLEGSRWAIRRHLQLGYELVEVPR